MHAILPPWYWSRKGVARHGGVISHWAAKTTGKSCLPNGKERKIARSDAWGGWVHHRHADVSAAARQEWNSLCWSWRCPQCRLCSIFAQCNVTLASGKYFLRPAPPPPPPSPPFLAQRASFREGGGCIFRSPPWQEFCTSPTPRRVFSVVGGGV